MWSTQLAASLRLLRADLSGEPPEVRERLLSEVIANAVQALPADQRRAGLAATAAEFPVAASAPVLESPAPEPLPPPPPVEVLPTDPFVVARHLVSLVPEMNAAQVQALAGELQQSGLLPVTAKGPDNGPPEQLQKRLEKLAPGRTLDVQRSLRLLDLLLDLTSNIDQLVWQIWKNVAPNSVLHREPGRAPDLRKYLAPYLTGDPEISTEQVRQTVEKSRKLIAGLLAAMGAIGQICAARVLSRLSPEIIRKAAGGESGVFESSDRKCWRKYNELFNELNGPVIEKEVMNGVRRYAEKLVLGADAAAELEE